MSSIEACREHSGHCKETSKDEPIHWIPAQGSKVTPEEWERLMSLINASDVSESITESNLESEIIPPEYTAEDDTVVPSNTSENTQRVDDDKEKVTKEKGKTGIYKIPSWIVALLFIFAISLIGLGISIFIGTFIPCWLLIGFSIIYSTERWFYFPAATRKYKYVGKLYRLLLNLSILSIIGTIIWSGIHLFSQQYFSSSLIDSLVFLAELAFFVWMWRVISRNSWRWPSMKLTVFVLVVVSVILAFAGVNPFSSYKDTIIDEISNMSSSLNDRVFPTSENVEESEESSEIDNTDNEPNVVIENPLTGMTSRGEYQDYFIGLVQTPEGVLSGNDCYGEFIVLINNKEAENPTYRELLDFLRIDKTDQYPYLYIASVLGLYYGNAEDKIDLIRIQEIIDGTQQPLAPEVCSDFAERLHNNAEVAGIRCGYVSLDITGYTDPSNLGISSDSGHACNVFETTDRGLIYIDCTGNTGSNGPLNNDRIVDIQVGQQYNPDYLFPSEGWYIPSGQMGVVTNMLVTWNGDWR